MQLVLGSDGFVDRRTSQIIHSNYLLHYIPGACAFLDSSMIDGKKKVAMIYHLIFSRVGTSSKMT